MTHSDDSQTRGSDYTKRLERLQGRGWKQVLDVQRPYRWNLRRWGLGRTIDVGCGIGRNLATLPEGSVGVDHNPTSVSACRELGLQAYVADDFHQAHRKSSFDSILVAHVLEHLDETTGIALLAEYLPYLKEGGRVLIITPQERGYHTDPTHVRWVALGEASKACQELGVFVDRQYSFPLPRVFGRVFYANEFVTVGTYSNRTSSSIAT